MNGLFIYFLKDTKDHIVNIWKKIKSFTNPGNLKKKFLLPSVGTLKKIFDLRPKDENDYYSIMGWLVSKRLAFSCVLFLSMISVYYVTAIHPVTSLISEENGTKTYSYHSIPLRFTKGKVKILAKSDYVAYEGEVEKGAANGSGTLYRKDGSKVYEGQFLNNMFEGKGVSYYPEEQLQYTGDFRQNLYHGNGSLYRKNGSLEYTGSFLEGKKSGSGILYDSSNNEIYQGNFLKDQILYGDFIGKSTKEINQIYKGKKTIYLNEEYFVVTMPDLNAIYYGNRQEENLTDEVMVEGVYVLKDTFEYAGEEIRTIFEMSHYLGDATFEGNYYVNMPEAVAIHLLNQSGSEFYGDVMEEMDQYLTDAVIVNEFDDSYGVYVYTYIQEDVRYTFFCKDRSGKFSMYLIEKEN